MNVPKQKMSKTDDGKISFPNLQCWNPISKIATIAAEVNGGRVSCRIKIDDLGKKFQINSDDPMQSITTHRVEIERAARQLIDQKNYEDDGSIMINYKDL